MEPLRDKLLKVITFECGDCPISEAEDWWECGLRSNDTAFCQLEVDYIIDIVSNHIEDTTQD